MKTVAPNVYTKKYYLTDATGYDEYKKTFGRQLEPRLKRIVKEIPDVRGLNVLDIGCGRGELAYWAVRRGADSVLGIDYSKYAIELANNAKQQWSTDVQEKIDFKLLDAKNMKFDTESYDAIMLTEVFEHLYLDEQKLILKKIYKILKKDGFLFIHTAPTRWFNDYTYRFWCYPVSTIIVGVNNLIFKSKYPNIIKPSEVRTDSHKIMHVNEPDFFSLRDLLKENGFIGNIFSTNITVNKPKISWKDGLFNFIVYLSPLSNYPPFNIFWGNDFYAILRKY